MDEILDEYKELLAKERAVNIDLQNSLAIEREERLKTWVGHYTELNGLRAEINTLRTELTIAQFEARQGTRISEESPFSGFLTEIAPALPALVDRFLAARPVPVLPPQVSPPQISNTAFNEAIATQNAMRPGREGLITSLFNAFMECIETPLPAEEVKARYTKIIQQYRGTKLKTADYAFLLHKLAETVLEQDIKIASIVDVLLPVLEDTLGAYSAILKMPGGAKIGTEMLFKAGEITPAAAIKDLTERIISEYLERTK